MDPFQRRALLLSAVVFAIAAAIVGVITRSWLTGAALFFVLHVVAWLGGWPPPSASNHQDHMLKNPGRGS